VTLFSRTLLAASATSLAFLASPGVAEVTLSYQVDANWIKDGERELAKRFETETGIKIDFQIVPSDQYFNVLKAKLNSGEAPDMYGGQSGVTDLKLNYNVAKNAVDLSNEPWAKQLDPLVAAQATVDGKLYGLTYWDTLGYVWVVNYNKQIFKDNGLTVPTNYAEFKNVCTTLLGAGIQPLYEPVSDGWHHVLWFPELGPRFEQMEPGLAANLNANKAKFADSPAMLEDLTQLKELYDLGCFGQDALSDTFAGRTAAMATGKIAMFMAQSAFPQDLNHDFPEISADSYGAFVMPLADNQMLNINPAGPTHFIYSGSKHIDEAKKYLEFLTRPENLQFYLDSEPQFFTLPFPGIKNKFTPELQAFMDAHATARGTVYQTEVNYVNPQWMDIGKDITAMFTGEMQPTDVLANVDKRRQELATAARDPAWAQ
jgi:raffinose/stachyose/melibiose transport system substrate-binding protein